MSHRRPRRSHETRSVYASLRTDLHEASAYSHRIDTLQLGVAPYEHDCQTLAVWFVIQARQYTGGLFHGTEHAASLENRLVAIATKPDADIADEVLRKALKDAGYDAKAIARTDRSLQSLREQLKAKK